MLYHLQKAETVLKELDSGNVGISNSSAAERLRQNGPNKLADAKKETVMRRFAEQIINPMIIVLIIAAIISFFLSEAVDAAVILVVVLLNSILGVVQESKSEKSLEALQAMTKAQSKVKRGGEVITTDSQNLVPGDIVILEAGDAVPADVRIIESASLKTDESALTGESNPVEKTAAAIAAREDEEIPLGDRKNMAYMGTSVVYGRGEAVVTATGMDTEIGRIAGTLAQAHDRETPLQTKLNSLSKILSICVLAVCVFIFAFSLLKTRDFSRQTVLNTFLLAVSLAVAAIPEGLACVVTIVLSIGVSNMSKSNAIIRKLTAVETLGCTEIICTDKTGTLTQNKMTVTDTFGAKALLAKAMALCNDAQVSSKSGKIVGEPTECALAAFALDEGVDKNSLQEEFPRIGEAPFDSMRKMMSTVHSEPHGGFVQYTKGAPDEMLKKCDRVMINGEIIPISDEIKQKITDENSRMAEKALRVLSAAYKPLEKQPEDFSPETLETNMIFVGLAGMIDPVRPEAVSAVKQCREAGIRPVMITGDHKDTAAAIAKNLGIISSNSEIITGSDLNKMPNSELEKNIANYGAYARVQPEHKVRIVKAWQNAGKITAMTGDGVNDAPAIKNADIGVGMGITGTDVTKNAADMVLTDDNFATIVYSVKEGRRIYDNIRKAVQFLLSSNLSEVIAIFLATMFGFVLFRPIHILWINLITDSFPAVALGLEKAEKGIMQRPPREKDESLFVNGMGFDIIYQGAATAIFTIISYYIGAASSHGIGMTMAFLTLSMCEIFHACNMRSQLKSVFTLHAHNKMLILTVLAAFLITTAMIYIPAVAGVFSLSVLSVCQYITSLLIAFAIIPLVEIVKAVKRRFIVQK